MAMKNNVDNESRRRTEIEQLSTMKATGNIEQRKGLTVRVRVTLLP